MAKKTKEQPNKTSTPKSEEKSATSNNILDKLFGEIPDTEVSNSLFSSENPFRRKPTDSIQTSQIPETPINVEVSKSESKTKKKSKDENSSVEVKKSKKKDKLEKNPNLGSIVNGSESNVNLEEKENKKKNKRKRDELEREYEVKKYGVAPDEEDEKKEKVGGGKKRKALDNPAEMMVSQEGYDDESKLLRTVFVGNLPLKTKKKALLKEFSQFGEIDSVRIRSVPTLDSKKPKKALVINGNLNEAVDSVNAYIVFKTEQAAEASLTYNMSMIGGNHVRVDRACPPRKKLKGDDASATLYNNKRTVFVGNLPFDAKDEELYQLFCNTRQLESSVEAVRVIRDRHTSLGKGIAYVLFKTREAANIVCKKRLKLRDRELRICHAKSSTQSSTPSKRKSPGDSESSPAKKFSAGTDTRSPAKKFSAGAKTPESRYKVGAGGDTSYQGLRASKSGEQKKAPIRRTATKTSFKPAMKSGDKIKQRTDKRPSVAARKAKAIAMQSGGASIKTGKRKMDARTPQSSNKKKKAMKSK
ncbi:RNA-binding protein 34-like [Chenopodium quinoa]|uniref:RNA-binding protein 34-like n=1 Tax=Chenopodium quinoa TaxID=63459 RepID=UPI000B78A2DD|nr:RNA-binding protein 34-like [Chenopodium quinoa]